MSFRRSVATCAFAAAFAMSSVLPADAQGGGGGGGGGGGFGGGAPPYTPEPGAKDLKAVLYNWAWHMGMLRGQAEPELIGTLDYHGEGTVQVDGQPCTLTKFRLQANYQIPGYRTQIECRRANGQTYSNVETMSGHVRLGRGPSGRGNRRRRGQGYAPACRAAGAADPSVGQPSRRGEGRDCGRGGSVAARRRSRRTRRRCSIARQPPESKARRRWNGKGIGPSSRFRSRTSPARRRRRHSTRRFLPERVVVRHGIEHDGVRLRQLPGLQQPAAQDRSHVRRHHRRAPQRHGRPRLQDDGDRDRPGVRGRARSGQRSGGRPAEIDAI